MDVMKNLVLVFALFCLCMTTGCGDSVSGRVTGATKHNVRKVAVMYKVYSLANNFEGPKNEAEFKAWIQGDEKVREKLAKFGINVDDFDSYMTSDRTGDKFEIKWGVKSAPMAPPYPVVFEPNELDGVRHVGMAGGKTREVEDDDEYDELFKGKYQPDELEVPGASSVAE